MTIRSTSSCDWCNTSFTTKNKRHRFCSTSCRKKSHRANNGKPLIPSFISNRQGKPKEAIQATLSSGRVLNIVNHVSTSESPKIAELKTRINWLESQKSMSIPSNGLFIGGGAALLSRLFTNDLMINFVSGVAGYFYGKNNDKDKLATIKLQNANLQRQIDELRTQIMREKDRIKNIPPPPSKDHNEFKIISASRVGELEHEKYELDAKWRYFLNYLPTSFNAIIYGLPKAGKTHLAIQFAQYLEKKFGKVMYISGEEGVEQPFNEKLERYNCSFNVAYDVKGSFGIMKAIEKTNPKFVFVDSLNRLNLDVDDIIKFKNTFPGTVFIYVMQATKEGRFKGSQSIEHEVTSTIQVVDGVAHQKGRTVPEPTEMQIF